MAIRLEIHATDPEVISLVQRYWAMNEEGEFLEKVSALLPFREVKNSAGVAGFVRTHCRVIDESLSCSICGGAVTITARSQVNKDPQPPAKPCASCKAAQDEELRVVETEAKARLQSVLAKYSERVDAMTTRYDEIPDDIALIALALDRTVASGLVGRSITYRDCRALAPMGADEFFLRLRIARVLSDAPRTTAAAAYSLDAKGGLSFDMDRAKFFLVPDERLGAGEEAFQKIVGRSFDDKRSLLRLWFDYAATDCMSYLNEQCHEQGLEVPENQVKDIRSAIRTAVQFYSISQVWCLLWKVVKEVSGIAHHRFYKDDGAGGTISERLLHHYEQNRKRKKELKSWNRVDFLPAGMLGKVFKERFGIDQDTSGVAVARLFSEGPSVREEIEASIDAKVKQLMDSALAAGSGAAAIYDFAELIRNGVGTVDAVEKIAKIYSVSHADEVSPC